MCKLLMIPGIKPEFKDDTWKFIFEMADQMSAPHTFEKDGMGFTGMDDKGNIFGERWLRNFKAFHDRSEYGPDIDNKWLKEIKILNKQKIYNKFGTLTDNISAFTLHSRAATNEVNIKNTHPFVEGNTSVIHNGVITNDEKLTKKYSTCDSEVILHEYIKHNVMNKPGKFQKVADKLEGSYALGILSKTSQNVPIMDVIKDSNANLDWFVIKELGTIVFATPRFNTNPVSEAVKILGFTIQAQGSVKDCMMQRFNAVTGVPIFSQKFKPKERYSNAHSKTYGHVYDQTKNTWENYDRGHTLADRYDRTDEKVIVLRNNPLVTPTPVNALDKNVKDRLLEETLVMGITNDKLLDEQRFNDDGNEWFKDDSLVWHRKDG